MKQALINLSKHRRTELGTQDPFQLTCAILFFGVPCRGLDGERLGLAAIARGQSTQGFLSDLRGDSPMVDDLAQDFIGKFQGRDTVQIFSFYETKESGTAIKVRLSTCHARALDPLTLQTELFRQTNNERT